MRTIVLMTIVSLLSLSGCSAVMSRPADGSAVEKRVVELVNGARLKGVKCGNTYHKAVKPLVWNDALGEAALTHALDMAQNGFLSHTGSDGGNPGTRISKLGYKWSMYGEDIGQGYRTPEDAVQGWLRSEPHCKNMMNPEFREAGAAYAKSGSLRNYWALVFGTPAR